VILGLRKPLAIQKVGITFEGKTTRSGTTVDKPSETQLFSIEEILWNAAPTKGKAVEGVDGVTVMPGKLLSLNKEAENDFLFAIQWPHVNYPPSLPPGKSLVHTEYVLQAFLELDNGEKHLSEPLFAEFRPHIDPSVVSKETQSLGRRESVVKDEDGRTMAEASLSCTAEEGMTFGSHCPLTLDILIRQSESKPLPRRAKVEICEIHKCPSDDKEHVFVLSQETLDLPLLLRPHHETSIPLKVKIPVPEVDERRKSATGLPTLKIGLLQVEYMIRVTVFLTSSRLSLSMRKDKAVAVDCPIVIGNVIPKSSKSARKIPRLVVNVEGEGSWEDQGVAISGNGHEGNKILEWSPDCEIPRFLGNGDVGEEDLQ
jgi:hypothetical protein